MFAFAQVTDLRGQVAVQEERRRIVEEQLKRVQSESLAESRKQILDFITNSDYKGLRDMVEYGNEARKQEPSEK